MHGHFVDQEELQGKANTLRDIIQKKLAEKLQIGSQPDIRPRGLFAYRGSRYWIKSAAMPGLPELERMAKDDAITFYSDPVLLLPDEASEIDAAY